MAEREIVFVSPVVTAGLPGLPDRLTGVAEARRVVQATRPPVARSCHAWIEASNRLTLALTVRTATNVEAARLALVLAVVNEGSTLRPAFALAA